MTFRVSTIFTKRQADIEAYDDSFVSRFREKYPEISRSDFQLCMLLRCGFSNPELELVYSITPQPTIAYPGSMPNIIIAYYLIVYSVHYITAYIKYQEKQRNIHCMFTVKDVALAAKKF